MVRTRITYFRNEDKLDQLISEAVEKLDGDNLLSYDLIESLYSISVEDIPDVIIIKGNIDSSIIGKIRNRLISVIEIIDNKNISDYFYNYDEFFFEHITEFQLKESPYNLSKILKKNIYFIKCHIFEKNLMAALVSLLNEGVTLFDLNGRIIESNARILGYTEAELKGRCVFDFLDKADIPQTKSYIQQALENKNDQIVTYEANLIKKDGSLLPVEINAKVFRNSLGDPIFFIVALTDISDKRNVWEKEQFLAHIIDSSRDGIIAIDQNNKISFWNRGAEELFNFSAKEIIGKEITQLAPDEETLSYLKKCIEKAKHEGYVKNLVIDQKRKDGKVIKVEITISALRNQPGTYKGISATIRDISNVQKNLDEAQKKNEEMEHLINVVSHEIRSPMHSVNTYLSIIGEAMRNHVQDENIFEMFERIHANIANLEELIQDLTDFSRVGSDKGEEVAVNLNSVVQDIVSDLQWQMGKENFQVKVGKLPTVRIDPGRIHQVFENLLVNAYKFRKDREIAIAEIEAYQEDDFIVFLIKDNGIGISPEHQERIFNLFYRSKEKVVEGTGAGLAIARKIINSYGGTISLESKVGEGSIFIFTLPSLIKVD